MTQKEILKAIEVLTKVVEVNRGWFGNEYQRMDATQKIKKLMKKLD